MGERRGRSKTRKEKERGGEENQRQERRKKKDKRGRKKSESGGKKKKGKRKIKVRKQEELKENYFFSFNLGESAIHFLPSTGSQGSCQNGFAFDYLP